MSFWSSASLIGWSGRLRSWLWVVVKPFTSSPAMPTTTCDGRKPAISSASWRATAQLSTTAAMSATVPDCMWDRPWRLRPTPRTVPWPSSPISKTRAFANSVPMSSAVQMASASPLSRWRIRRQKAIQPALVKAVRIASIAWPSPSAFVPLPCAISGRPPPRPSIAVTASFTRSAGRNAARDEVVADRHEDLGLVALEPQRDHAVVEGAADVLRDALERVDRLERPGERDELDARRDFFRPRRELARLRQPRSPTRPQSTPGLAQLALDRPDPVRESLGRLAAGFLERGRERLDLGVVPGVGAGPGQRLDPADPRPDRFLTGNDEATDLARGPRMSPAAELVRVALDPDRANGLAVFLVEERIRAGVDRLLHGHVARRDRAILADDASDLVLDRS